MSVIRQRTPGHINRTIRAQADPRRSTAADNGSAGYSETPVSFPSFRDPDASALDFRALASRGMWTEDNDWSLQWWPIASAGLFDA